MVCVISLSRKAVTPKMALQDPRAHDPVEPSAGDPSGHDGREQQVQDKDGLHQSQRSEVKRSPAIQKRQYRQ
jgi:hypothetical protein